MIDTLTKGNEMVNQLQPGPQSRTIWSIVCTLSIASNTFTNWSIFKLLMFYFGMFYILLYYMTLIFTLIVFPFG